MTYGRGAWVVGLLVAVALAVAQAPSARAAGISDIVSDFLYYEEELKVTAPTPPIQAVIPGIGERYIALVDTAQTIRIWDFETGSQLTVEGSRAPGTRATFANRRGGNLIVIQADGRVDETVGMSFNVTSTILAAGSAVDAVAVSERSSLLAAAGGGRLQVYNFATKRTAAVTVANAVTRLAVSDDGRFVAFRAGSILRVLDVDRPNSPVLEIPAGDAALSFFPETSGGVALALQDSPTHLTIYRWDGHSFAQSAEHVFAGEKPAAFWIHDEKHIYWTAAGSLHQSAIGASRGEKVFATHEPILYVRKITGGDSLLVVQRSGAIGVFDPKAEKFVATAISTQNGWAVIDARKRYDGSSLGGREVSWVIQKTQLELDKFARHFFEPGLLLHYVGQQQLPFTSEGSSEKIPLPPTISELKLLENVANSGRTVALTTARSIKSEVADIEVYHNGKRVADGARISDQAESRDDLQVRSSGYEIHPRPGPNTVAVIGVGGLGIEGPIERLSFERPGIARGVLHVLAVGVDKYAAPKSNLDYARGDAETIAKMMRASKGFENVQVAEIYDSDATREAVLSELKAMAARAAADDTILVYLAGHGIATTRSKWFFVSPVVSAFDEREITRLSISAEELADTLTQSKAAHIVLMIDACNSGAVVRDVKGLLQNRLYATLGRTTGFAVLAASRQEQSALERRTLGHGVFTAATLAALSGAADRNGDGRVTARELATYLSREIPTLATEHLNEIQVPVAYAPSEDFLVRGMR